MFENLNEGLKNYLERTKYVYPSNVEIEDVNYSGNCIYAIISDDGIYIGECADYKYRIHQHLSAFFSNRHHVKELQETFNNSDNIKVVILEKLNCNASERRKIEGQYIKDCRKFTKVYNKLIFKK